MDTLDDIASEKKGAPEAAARPAGWGGSRKGSGRKGKTGRTSPAPSAPDEASEPLDPEVQALLDEFGDGKETMGTVATLAVLSIDPTRPPSAGEIRAMAVTGNAVANKYLGKAGSMLGLEGVCLLIWGGILLQRYLTRSVPGADASHPDSGSVRDGQNNARPPTGPTLVVS